MRKSSLSFLVLFLGVAFLFAGDADVFRPTSWKLSDAPGSLSPEGVLQVTGTGETCNYFLSEAYPFQAGHLYMVTFEGRFPHKARGTAITGISKLNTDHLELTQNWETYSDLYAFQNNRETGATLRMGQWHLLGDVEFRNIRVAEVYPIYAQMDGIILGDGESLKTSEYVFVSSYNSRGHMESRVLDTFTTGFNTDRLVFGAEDEIIYRFDVNGRKFQKGHLETGIHYYEAGCLSVAISADKEKWTEVASLNKADSISIDLPQEFFPAEVLYLRLKAVSGNAYDSDKSDAGSFQVNNVRFIASIDGGAIELMGSTRYAEILKKDGQLEVTIQDVGDAVPGGDNRLTMAVKNLTQKALTLQPKTILQQDQRVCPPTQAEPVVLEAGEDRLLSLPYALDDTGTWMLLASFQGDASLEIQCQLTVSDYFNTSYGELLSQDGTAAIWSAAPEWKIPQNRMVPKKTGDALRVAAAQGESEAVQLVLTPSQELTGVNFQMSDLKNAQGDLLSASNLELLRVHYLDIQKKTDASSVLGYWPDPLPAVRPDMTLAANRTQPFFLRANVPENTPGGIYKGVVTITAAHGWKATIPLEIRVFGFALPKEMTCQTGFGFDANVIQAYHKPQTEEECQQLVDIYLKFLSRNHISPYNPAPLILLPVTLQKGETLADTHVNIDWTRWDVAMEKALDEYHFNSFVMPIEGLGSGTFHSRIEPKFLGFSEDTPEYQKLHPEYLGILQEHLKQKGWLEKAYVYWFDEPDTKDYDFVLNGFRKLKEGAPQLRRLLTESIEPPLLGGPNLWCPHTYGVNDDDWAARRALGEQCWWYLCTGPKAPYATLFIDHPGIEMRLWLWQSWQHKIQGVLMWSSNYWTSPAAYPDGLQNPYTDPMSWVSGYDTPAGTKIPWGNGDGRLLYPPEAVLEGPQESLCLEDPVSSIRMEMLRDGIEDYEYFVILQKLIAEKAHSLTPDETQRYSSLLEVPAEVTSEMTKFNVDSSPMKAHRIKLAEAIEALLKK